LTLDVRKKQWTEEKSSGRKKTHKKKRQNRMTRRSAPRPDVGRKLNNFLAPEERNEISSGENGGRKKQYASQPFWSAHPNWKSLDFARGEGK